MSGATAADGNAATRPAPIVAVVDYGAGNLVSIDQALTSVGARVVLVRSADEFAAAAADALIVPGVGAAGPAMERLTEAWLVEPIRRCDVDQKRLERGHQPFVFDSGGSGFRCWRSRW